MHFATPQIETFTREFLGPVKDTEEVSKEWYDVYEDEDDGLGYYPDGVKRTLTDDQIAMFRHSEIQTLLRKQQRAAEDKEYVFEGSSNIGAIDQDANSGDLAQDDTVSMAGRSTQGIRKKRKARNKKQSFKQNVKPDLRKRTWDKVDEGMDGLDYGEEESSTMAIPTPAPSRRRISYDD